MSSPYGSLLASALVLAAACSATKDHDAGVEDLAVADLAPVHTRTLIETSCPASLAATYSRCYVDHQPTDFF